VSVVSSAIRCTPSLVVIAWRKAPLDLLPPGTRDALVCITLESPLE
jgi:hypothetical protein